MILIQNFTVSSNVSAKPLELESAVGVQNEIMPMDLTLMFHLMLSYQQFMHIPAHQKHLVLLGVVLLA